MKATVLGAGLAGSEAAWQLAENKVKVSLYEMRPKKMTPAHNTDKFAELVCSNSFRADRLENAAGLLKEEMRLLNSLILKAADYNRVPAGGALAVDREGFSAYITEKITSHPNIKLIRREVEKIPNDQHVIIATGPLTSDPLFENIAKLVKTDHLYFYDAAAPIISYDSINHDKVFKGSRYNRGDDYINCPMNKEQYLNFYNELIKAETAPIHEFEDIKLFEACMPIESMAKRGVDTLRYGPLKPVGFRELLGGQDPYAIVQLRQDNAEASLYNMVGFQTRLKFKEQKRVFSMIPGLENLEIVRYGVMHRNTFIDSPRLLDKYYRLRANKAIYFAGQITGVEGYIESAASGLVSALNLSRVLAGKEPLDFTNRTAIGALANYISNPTIKDFQPMNINYKIIEPLEHRIPNKAERNKMISQRALNTLNDIIEREM